ncbi:hypothetical protein EXS65_02145 [Candidatus Peribacteria bacterium]|nr:hypothetical protein [Candidatus Peribacteria bacterium]
MLQAPTQDVRSPVRWNDDGKFRHTMYDTPVSMSSLTLFIDLCSHRKIIACVDQGKTLALAEISDHTDEADLMPAIERLLSSIPVHNRSGRSISSAIDRIAAISGPGGFMSQRVEMSLGNALSWGLRIPIAGIHLSDVWAARVSKSLTPIPTPESFLWLHSTQKTSLFIRGFGTCKTEWPEPTLISLDDARKRIPPDTIMIGELIPEHCLHFTLLPADKMKPIEDVLQELCERATYGNPPMLPWYGRGI